MIKVKVVKESANYKKITITGHAMYDDFGKDIVCSAASSIVTTSVNSIVALSKDSLEYKVSEGSVIINILDNNNITSNLIGVMLNLLKELENNYPDNIQIK